MRESLTVVTRKGQITVPVELRRLWSLKEGDKVAITLPDSPGGTVTLRPVRSVAEMTFGALSPGRLRYDIREQREAVMEDAVERDEKTRPRNMTRKPPNEKRGADEGVRARRH